MLTPSKIREKTYKNGLGYDKKDVEQFVKEVSNDFEQLLSENESLNKNIKDLTDSISYYKSIEKTLQKALVIAEKTAQDIKNNANKEAEVIVLDAKANAKIIETQAIKQSEMLEHKTLNLIKQYDLFKAHYRNLLNAQLELLNSTSFSLNTPYFSYSESWSSKPEPARLENSHEDEVMNKSGLQEETNKNDLKMNSEATHENENAFEFITTTDEDF
jgi:cell division initiation protein